MNNNYLCVNGKKTPLTEQQLADLGITVQSALSELVESLRAGNAREHYNIHDVERAFGERRAALTAEYERLVGAVLAIADKHGLVDEVTAELKQLAMPDIPLLEGVVGYEQS